MIGGSPFGKKLEIKTKLKLKLKHKKTIKRIKISSQQWVCEKCLIDIFPVHTISAIDAVFIILSIFSRNLFFLVKKK